MAETTKEGLEARLERHAHDLVNGGAQATELRKDLTDAAAVIRALVRPEPLVAGYNAAFWHESYTTLRDAVMEHLADCIREDDVAEEAILVEAIETAGKRLASLPANRG